MRLFLMLALVLHILACPAWARASAAPAVLREAGHADLLPGALLFHDSRAPVPSSAAGVPAWLAAQKPARQVELTGGAYWVYARVRNDSAIPAWVLDPNDTPIEHVQAHLIGADGSVQQLQTGYAAQHQYMLHYGKDLTLAPGVEYHLLIRLASRYYARTPVLSMMTAAGYRDLVARQNFLIIASLGALAALAIFNFFIFSFARDRTYLYYTLFVLAYAVAWALTLNVVRDLLEFRWLELHNLPFFLLPVFSTLFYLHFLRLHQLAPRLAKISRINIVLPLLLLPSCFFALGVASTLANIVLTIWLGLGIISGVVAWRAGHPQARYFVFGFIALMLPGLVILPANLGLVPVAVHDANLLSLLGGTLDGLLLAFAMADQIRLLRRDLEHNVQRRTEELVRANAALTLARDRAEVVSRHRIDFLSSMSHDIRTPLAGVIGMVRFALRDRAVRGNTEEYLRIALQNGEALLAIVNDILDFSKIDAGKLTLEQISFRLEQLVRDAVAILRGEADAKKLTLRCVLREGLPEYVEGDPTRIRQILLNLLGNAIKFTEQGEVVVRVSAAAGPGGRVDVTLSVEDTGPGIGDEVKARLFQRFEQADHSTTRRYGGSGLGLAICKELVGLMHGSIAVESAVGAGARFTVTLPLAAGAAPDTPGLASTPARHARRLRVLCAEDVRTNQIIIGTLLESMGHQVHIVENGVEALRALARADFDLVLMDGRMPVMDGEQATRLIRQGGSETQRVRDPMVPIIAFTANASAHDCARYIEAGMDGFLSKPVDERALFEQIERVIGGTPTSAASRDQALARQFGVAPAPEPEAGGPIRIIPLPGLSSGHMERITEAFLQEAPRRLAVARMALEADDAPTAMAAFHALKGSAGYLSSPELHVLAGRMEALARDGLLAAVWHQFADIEQALDDAMAGLRSTMGATP